LAAHSVAPDMAAPEVVMLPEEATSQARLGKARQQ